MLNIKRNFGYLFFTGVSVALIGAALTATPAKAFDRVAAPLSGATQWLNSAPLSMEGLRGKVVLVDFWTYSCINCLNALPHVKDWAAKYHDQGLVVIGVHTPEFAFEKDQRNVEQAISRLGITFPVAMDNQYEVWNAYQNRYWPAQYLIDAQGQIRREHFGEGEYQETEQLIQTLLSEAHQSGGASKH